MRRTLTTGLARPRERPAKARRRHGPTLEWLEPRWLLTSGTTAASSPLYPGPALVPAVAGTVALAPFAPPPATPPAHAGPAADEPTDPTGSGSPGGFEVLPPDGDVQITDALGAHDPERMYRIPIGPTIMSVAVELQAEPPGSPVVEGMSLIDDQGHDLASREPPPGCLSLSLDLPPPPLRELQARGGSLFLKLVAPAAMFTASQATSAGLVALPTSAANSAAASPQLDYVLSVQRQSVSDGTPVPAGGTTTRVTASVVPSGRLDWVVSPTLALVGSSRTTGNDGAAPAGAGVPQVVGVAVATGALPGRAVGPLGGVLSPGDEETVIDRSNPAVVDLALLGLPSEATDRADLPRPAGDTLAAAGDALVAVRGPGGFPLFGTSLLTETRPDRGFVLPGLSAPIEAIAAAPVLDPTTLGVLTSSRPTTIRGIAVFAGFSAAFTMASRLILPGLTDPVRGRISLSGRLRWRLRRAKPRV